MIINEITSFNEYLLIISAYFIGSIPFGIIISKIYGVADVTKQGSGNIGATNVARVVGKKAGAITLILDFLKCFIPATIYGALFQNDTGVVVCALICVIGHIFPIFNKFNGGKGVACGLGAIAAVNPIVFLLTIATWLIMFFITKISSVGALASFGMMPFFFFALAENTNIMLFGIILSIIIFIRHKENIIRLLNGEEKSIK